MTTRTLRKAGTAGKDTTPAAASRSRKAPASTVEGAVAPSATAKGGKRAAAAGAAPAAPKKAPPKAAAAGKAPVVPASGERTDAAPKAAPRRRAVAPQAAAAPVVAQGAVEAPVPAGIDAGARHRLICEAAYGIYAARGHIGGRDFDDWLEAEAAVDRMLASRGTDAVAPRGA